MKKTICIAIAIAIALACVGVTTVSIAQSHADLYEQFLLKEANQSGASSNSKCNF